MNTLLLSATSLLVAIWGLKLYAIARAVLWLRRNGTDYVGRKKVADASPDANHQQYYQVLDYYKDAQFFPFGLNDYRAYRCAKTARFRTLRWAAAFVSRVAFRGVHLAWLTWLWLFGTGVLHNTQESAVTNTRGWWLVFALAVCPFLNVFMLCVESITAYATMRSYAWAFHMRRPSGNKHFDELVVILALLGLTILASATAAYVSTVFVNAFKGDALICPKPGSIFEHSLLFLQSVYFAVTTIATVGYGDIVPANGWGQVVATLTILVSFSLIIFVLASLSAISSDTDDVGS